MALIRLALSGVIILVCIWLIVAHGVRGIVIVGAVVLAVSLPQTRVWQTVERWLIRLTGSRRRAAALAFGFLIAAVAAFNIYQLVG